MVLEWRSCVIAICVILCLYMELVKCGGGRDFYKILGVNKQTPVDQVKKKYRKLARKYHPDANPEDPDATQRFRDIAEAHEVLSDPKKKQLYDTHGEEGLDPNFDANRPRGGHPFVFRSSQFGTEFFDMPFGFEGFGGFDFGGGPGGHGRPGGGRRRPQQASMYENTDVTEVTDAKSWASTVFDLDFPWVTLVNFHSPGCGRCNEIKDEYVQIAKVFAKVVTFAAVDCTRMNELCRMEKVQKYPTIRLYHSDKSKKPVPFVSDDLSRLGAWVSNVLPSSAKMLSTANFEDWLVTNTTMPKVILFTNKELVPPIYKHVTTRFKGSVSAAVVVKIHSDVTTTFFSANPPKKFPALLHVVDLDEVSGEWIDPAPDSDILALTFSRMASEKRGSLGIFANQSRLREWTFRQHAAGNCAFTDSRTCVLLAFYGKENRSKVLSALEVATAAYKSDPVVFLWMNADFQTDVASVFGLSVPCGAADKSADGSCSAALIAFRPKRKKFSVIRLGGDVNELVAKFCGFVDSVITGANNLQEKLPKDVSFKLKRNQVLKEVEEDEDFNDEL
eukprot:Lankesteria_metandrocarpae@DN4032_c0_g1_i1.p1